MLTSLVLVVLLLGLLVAYIYLKYNANYFRRKGVPFIPSNILVGNIADGILGGLDFIEMVEKWYNHPAGKNLPYIGLRIFNSNIILAKDPDLVKRIMITDFNKFSNRVTSDSNCDPMLESNLFFLMCPKWKPIRSMMTPVFSSGKVKQMFPLIDDVSIEYYTYSINLLFCIYLLQMS